MGRKWDWSYLLGPRGLWWVVPFNALQPLDFFGIGTGAVDGEAMSLPSPTYNGDWEHRKQDIGLPPLYGWSWP